MPDPIITTAADGNSGSVRPAPRPKPPLNLPKNLPPGVLKRLQNNQPKQAPHRARTTVVEQVYHQRDGDHTPTSMRPTFHILHQDDTKPYQGELQVGEEWIAPELAHFDGKPVGMVHIYNLEGKFYQRIPTAEEKAEAAERVVEVGIFSEGKVISTGIFVTPLRSARFEMTDPSILRLKCRKGTSKTVVTLFPPE